MLRLISKEPQIILRVVFENNPENLDYFDPGFKRKIEWDLPLTDGYNNEYLSNTNLDNEIKNADVLWLHGWGSSVVRKALRIAKREGVPVLMRGEITIQQCQMAMDLEACLNVGTSIGF